MNHRLSKQDINMLARQVSIHELFSATSLRQSKFIRTFSSENIVTAFINAINAILIAPNDNSATRSATEPANGGESRTTEGNIFANKIAFPTLAQNRNRCNAWDRMFCRQERRKSAPNRAKASFVLTTILRNGCFLNIDGVPLDLWPLELVMPPTKLGSFQCLD
mmetsp:Transcript_21081/g.44052  ORF Transcript_21081/g.44052 Transcript_21081/m.44052 type:complete len:164 (-) Transcript_21081:781-1272(-)